MKTPEDGIYSSISYEDYESWEAVRNTTLKIISKQSAAHAKEYVDNPKPPTDALEFGSLLHIKVLEPKLFDKLYIVAPKCDRRTKVGKATWAEFQESAEGRIVINQEWDDLTHAMSEAAFLHEDAKQFVNNGETEVSILWTDPETGLRCKARLDAVHWDMDVIVDLKSTKNAQINAFARDAFYYGYHQQAAFYRDGLNVLKQNEPAFVIVAMEKEPPLAVACYEWDDISLLVGRKTYRKALDIYAKCVETGVWPAYTDLNYLSVPKWAATEAGIGQEETL